MKSPTRAILGTWLAMVVLQTIGTVDAKHKLPAPKQYVTISVLWATFFLIADFGYGRAAARLSMLVLLTASVLGPFGQRFIDLLNKLAGVPVVAQPNAFTQPVQPQVNPQVRTA